VRVLLGRGAPSLPRFGRERTVTSRPRMATTEASSSCTPTAAPAGRRTSRACPGLSVRACCCGHDDHRARAASRPPTSATTHSGRLRSHPANGGLRAGHVHLVKTFAVPGEHKWSGVSEAKRHGIQRARVGGCGAQRAAGRAECRAERGARPARGGSGQGEPPGCPRDTGGWTGGARAGWTKPAPGGTGACRGFAVRLFEACGGPRS
jgi:hypothetical protein